MDKLDQLFFCSHVPIILACEPAPPASVWLVGRALPVDHAVQVHWTTIPPQL